MLKNIERGKNTPSLRLFIGIIRILNLSADKFIYPDSDSSNDTYQQLLRLLKQCTQKERKILLENAHTLIENREEKPIEP